jgi:hypothetical protein
MNRRWHEWMRFADDYRSYLIMAGATFTVVYVVAHELNIGFLGEAILRAAGNLFLGLAGVNRAEQAGRRWLALLIAVATVVNCIVSFVAEAPSLLLGLPLLIEALLLLAAAVLVDLFGLMPQKRPREDAQ